MECQPTSLHLFEVGLHTIWNYVCLTGIGTAYARCVAWWQTHLGVNIRNKDAIHHIVDDQSRKAPKENNLIRLWSRQIAETVLFRQLRALFEVLRPLSDWSYSSSKQGRE